MSIRGNRSYVSYTVETTNHNINTYPYVSKDNVRLRDVHVYLYSCLMCFYRLHVQGFVLCFALSESYEAREGSRDL